MSKKNYKHRNPHITDPLLTIENRTLRTKLSAAEKERDTLQIALRMLTSADRDTLLQAVEQVTTVKNSEVWFNIPVTSTYGSAIGTQILNDPMTQPVYTATAVLK